MRLESKKYLFDILQAAKNLDQFSHDKAFSVEIDDRIVWDILRNKLPNLLQQVESLLDKG